MTVPSNLRAGLAGAAVLALGVLAAWVGGAFGESPEDQVNAIADDFHGELTRERVEAALAHVDPSVAPIEVSARGFTRVYGNGALPDLRRDATRALAPVMGESFRELRRTVTLADDKRSAGAVLQLLSTSRGTATVDLSLVRDGERWLVRRVGISR